MGSIKTFLRANLWLPVVVIIIAVALYQLVEPAPPREFTMATGSEGGFYHQGGLYLQKRLKEMGTTLHLVNTAGSAENLELLTASDSDVVIAFVQSGLEELTEDAETPLRSLGSLYYEPMWLFYRVQTPIQSLGDLKGYRVAVGEQGSGTRVVAMHLLKENGLLKDPGLLSLADLDVQETIEALSTGAVDAAFLTVSPRSEVIQALIEIPGVDFLDIERSDAYTARYPSLSTVDISEGLLSIERNIPDSDRRTMASTATLVVNERFHPGMTPLVLEILAERLHKGGMLERPAEFPSSLHVDFELTDEARYYYDNGPPFLMRYLPFWIASLVDRLIIFVIPLIVILVPLFKIAPPLYRWRIRSRIYQWYAYLLETDRNIVEGTVEDPAAEKEKLDSLANELAAIDVPLSYSDELYQLKQHVEYVSRRLDQY